MKKFIHEQLRKYLIKEATAIAPLDFSTNNMQVAITDEEREQVKQVQWNQIKLEDLPSSNNVKFKFDVILPFKNNFQNEIQLSIDLKGGLLYQLDISLPNKLQGLGLAPKIYKAIIMDFGHVYSAKARVHNPNVYKVFDKLRHDNDIECVDGKNATLCSSKNNTDKEKLFNVVKGL